MGTPVEELQVAVIAALKADAAVAAEVGDRVIDGRGDLAQGPTISMGRSQSLPTHHDQIEIETVFLQIDVWVESGGRIWPARVLADQVKAVLDRADLALATHALAGIDARADAMLDPDGLTGHGIVNVEAEIEVR